MFFKYNSISSQLETILAQEDVTLQEVMDQEDILNECKVQNKILIDYLIKPEILEELVSVAICEPPEDLDERIRFKYPNIACELLTCNIPTLNERLAGDESLLQKLYFFLETEPPLNPLLASFFSKIMSVLIAKKTGMNWLSYQLTSLQVIDFLKAKINFIPLLLKHIGTTAIAKFLLTLMTQVEGSEIRLNTLNYLDSQRIIQTLIGLYDTKEDKEKHDNVSGLLCDFIYASRENVADTGNPDPLLDTLESPEVIALLVDRIFCEDKQESIIVGVIQVLFGILEFNCTFSGNNNYTEMKAKVRESTSNVLLKRLKDFHQLLLDPPKKEPVITTVGLLNPPLGNTRLHVVKLLALLINYGGPEISQELISLGTMDVLLDLFFAFPWNNFLHTQVQACIIAALETPLPSDQGDNIALSKHLLVNCKLSERILKAWKDNEENQSKENGLRQGYMGHLINIANSLVNLCSEGPLGDILRDNMPEVAKSLMEFKENDLSETNKIQEKLLGGVHPRTSNEDNDDNNDNLFIGLGQQNFNEYQMQQINPHVSNSYGFADNDFKNGDDALQIVDHRTGMNFDLSEDLLQQYELFKQVCAETINTLDDSEDQIFEDKEHNTFQTVIEKETDRNSSSDSDDNGSPQGDDPLMDIETWNSPTKASEAPLIMSKDPWATGNSIGDSGSEATGWADFSSAIFGLNFENTAQNPFDPPEVSVENNLKVEDIEIEDKNNKTEVIEFAQTKETARNDSHEIKQNEAKVEANENKELEQNEAARESEKTEKVENVVMESPSKDSKEGSV